MFGALICAVAVARFGSRGPLTVFCAGAAASAFLLQGVNIKDNSSLLIFGLGVHGLFATAVQSVMYALCAYVYPTVVRATGTAAALSVGRFGAILSSFAGAAVITADGATAYLTLLGGSMIVVQFALLIVRNHIPKVEPAPKLVGQGA